MKKSLRLSASVMSVLLSTTLLLTACASKQGATTDNQGSKSSQTQAVSDKPVEISYMVTMDLAVQDSYSTQKLPELLKKKGYNVTLKMKSLGTHDGTEWGQKYKLMISSGENPPDIIQQGSNPTDSVKAGWFAELNMDMIKKTIPKYVAQVDKIYKSMWAWGKDIETGKLYGIPSFNMFGSNRHAFVYRADWLKKVGMEAPKTLDEFEKWLREVRAKDPNGNGQKDEYGYTSGTDQPGVGFSEIFGAYGIMPGQWMLKDGKVVRGEIQPEAKEALKLLKKWYSEDLIPKGVLTTVKAENDFYANIAGTLGTAKGYAPALVPSGMVHANVSKNPGAEITVVPSPKGPDGKFGTWEWGPRKYNLSFGKHLEKDSKKLEMILKMFETIATDKELFELTMLGEKGKHWEFVDKAANKGGTAFLAPYTDYNRRLNEVGVREMSESTFCPFWVEEVYKDYLDPLAVKYASINTSYWDILLSIPTQSSTQYQTSLDNLMKATYLDIITGKKPVESFDEFVQKWKTGGGDQLTKEANELYEKAFK